MISQIRTYPGTLIQASAWLTGPCPCRVRRRFSSFDATVPQYGPCDFDSEFPPNVRRGKVPQLVRVPRRNLRTGDGLAIGFCRLARTDIRLPAHQHETLFGGRQRGHTGLPALLGSNPLRLARAEYRGFLVFWLYPQLKDLLSPWPEQNDPRTAVMRRLVIARTVFPDIPALVDVAGSQLADFPWPHA